MSYEPGNISTPSNSSIEKHYGKGVIGPGYFIPRLDWAELSSEDRLKISPEKAPKDLYEDTASYLDPNTQNWKPLEVQLEAPNLTDVEVLLEKKDQITEEDRLDGEHLHVAYGEHPMNIYGNSMV